MKTVDGDKTAPPSILIRGRTTPSCYLTSMSDVKNSRNSLDYLRSWCNVTCALSRVSSLFKSEATAAFNLKKTLDMKTRKCIVKGVKTKRRESC